MARTLLAWQDGASCFICHGWGNGTQRTSIPNPATVCMTSEERHKLRYLRRSQKRLDRRKSRFEEIGGLAGAFTYHDMFEDGKDCCKGVRWKHSVQNFELHLFSATATARAMVLSGRWQPLPCTKFTICERGKIRDIEAPKIRDRQVQKGITRRILLPLYLPGMIHNNGASLKGKGFKFSQDQLKKDLRHHYRMYGVTGKILLLDFSNFFPTASHDWVMENHRRVIFDNEILRLCDTTLRSSGLPLGIEPSQAEMIYYPWPLDNWLKCQCGYKGMGHYMDDYYILLPPGAKDQTEDIAQRAAAIGLTVNRAKTAKKPLAKPFRYCKIRYSVGQKIRTVGSRESYQRAKRKLDMFARLIADGKADPEDARASMAASISYFNNYNDSLRRKRLLDRMAKEGICTTIFVSGGSEGTPSAATLMSHTVRGSLSRGTLSLKTGS